MDRSRLIVACLCAAWCTSCRAYRAVFDAAAAAHPGATFRWVDIEDEAALVDDLDIENFPTILIAGADAPRFFGTILPQPEVLARLIAAHGEPSGGRFDDEIVQLLERLREE
jgi:thiol-disulfide isomerase/thioredoxin